MPVSVKFGADTGDLEDGIARAQDAIQGLVPAADSLAGSFDNLKDSSGGVSAALAMIGGSAAIGGIAAVLAFIGKTNQEMLDLQNNAKEVGLTLKQYQEDKYAAGANGVDDQKFVSGLQQAAQKLNELKYSTSELSRFLDANNIKYRTANGELISTQQYLETANRLIHNTSDEQDKIKFTELLGFTREWVAVLDQVPSKFRAAMQAASDTGAVLDEKLIQKDAEFAQRWNETVSKWSAFFKAKIVELSDWLDTVLHKLDQIPQSGPKWSPDKATGADRAEIERERDAGQSRPEPGLEGALSDNQALMVLGALGEGPLGALMFGVGLHGEMTGSANDAGKTQNATDKAGQSIEAFADFVKRLGVDQYKPGSSQAASSEPGDNGPATKPPPPADKDGDAARAAITGMQAQIQAADLLYQNDSEKLAASLAMHQTTEAQKTAATIAAINQREDADLAAIAAVEARGDLTLRQWEQIEKERTAITLKAINDRTKAEEDAEKKEAQLWKSNADQIAGAFNSQLLKMLQGKENFAQASKQIEQDLLLKFIENQIKASAEFLAEKARQLAVELSTQAGMTSAATVGAALRSASEVAGGEVSILSVIANALKSIFASSGETAAAVTADLAPAIGPAAVPAGLAAGAAILGGASAMVASAATGGYVVRGGLLRVHDNETVVPARINQPYGAGSGSASDGDQHTHFHISTPNTRDMARALKDNDSAVMKAVKSALKRGAHLNPRHP